MKNKNLLKKVIFVAILLAIVFSLIAPAIFGQAPKQEKLLNGLKVLMWPDATSDKVTIRIRVHSGSAFDPQGKEGVMQLLANSIFPNEASREFFVEDLGGNLEVTTTYDHIEINASSRPESFLTMLETISTAVSNPTIDKETTPKLVSALAAKVATAEADPVYVANQAVAHRLFGTFPYGRPIYGTKASLEKISFADLIDAKQRFLTADNATIAVIGKFDRSLGFRAIRRYFGSWIKADKQVPLTFRQPDPPVSEAVMINTVSADPPIVRFALRGVARNEKDLPASMIAAAILQQRLRTRLKGVSPDELFVRSDPYALPGVITIGYTMKAAPVNDKLDLAQTVSKALAEPITDAEFVFGKAAFNEAWSKKNIYSFWLDADTYKIASPEADARIGERVTAAEVNAYMNNLRKLPTAIVLVNWPPRPTT